MVFWPPPLLSLKARAPPWCFPPIIQSYSSKKSYWSNMNPSRAYYLPVMVRIHLGTGSGRLGGKGPFFLP